MECTGRLLILYILNLQISGKLSDKSETSETDLDQCSYDPSLVVRFSPFSRVKRGWFLHIRSNVYSHWPCFTCKITGDQVSPVCWGFSLSHLKGKYATNHCIQFGISQIRTLHKCKISAVWYLKRIPLDLMWTARIISTFFCQFINSTQSIFTLHLNICLFMFSPYT